MSDWIIVTEGVKVAKDSVSLWPQIITAVSTIAAALGGVSLTHRFIRCAAADHGGHAENSTGTPGSQNWSHGESASVDDH